ncbi:ABC transporter ATP-binding protein [Sulfurimicrobium lacus]|uniref:ABC transporter ATP-binding protein n=1 Tax=Sulfurimicrobium lacus TaxID=2715678 RepID=A0A6F8VCG1_9PROT|nr:ABC transporter ATP-binding protein [Sulfurimicrobium lacus]BCB26652.1 ABC transporter ATP-binding protein [Sulfurimicrobium lacus]
MLSTENLHLEVPGKVLCQDLTLSLEAGQCWAVLGKNGSGKTTLLHALSGLGKPAAGRVCLDGLPLSEIPRRRLAQRVGALLQEETTAFSGTALDYVLLGRFPHSATLTPDISDIAAARRALQLVGMAHAERQALSTLSGGERQRVRIALLLAQAPDIYFLDEPLQHLDLPHQLAVMQLFRQLARDAGKTVVMVLHDIFWASRFCDHALLIHDGGKIAGGDTPLMITQNAMENLYQCRFQTVATSDGNYFLPTLE